MANQSMSEGLRQLEKQFDWGMIVAAFVVSFLGSFTSTQVMIQARTSGKFSHALMWIIVVSLTFGFCASWGLHFVGMLACTLDLPIELNIGTTLLSAALAISFTFIALGSEILWEAYHRGQKGERGSNLATSRIVALDDGSSPLLGHSYSDDRGPLQHDDHQPDLSHADATYPLRTSPATLVRSPFHRLDIPSPITTGPENRRNQVRYSTESDGLSEGSTASMSQHRNWGFGSSRVDDLMAMATQGPDHFENAFVATFKGVISGFSLKAVLMGLVWSLSLTCMHYSGLAAMRIPNGRMTLAPIPVILSALISWVVCIVGYIYMINVTSFLSQQILFSTVAATGIATMHFTGLHAATFWSYHPPTEARTWPVELPIAVCSVVILTCMLANGLLAQSAILSRNKLAEIVWTRQKLWRAIAEKENAEAAAAARSTFIASASHEIRTPLHHLQGYSDLLSQSDLSEPDRQLLSAIQAATKTLSLITNNVLDWSKLESGMDNMCRPAAVDLRSAAETVMLLLPTKGDDGVLIPVFLVIAPNVPQTLMLDETYIHRILMNLLSNSLKFTPQGHITLGMRMCVDDLVITVEDTGLGIPKDFFPRLFDPFSQAKTIGSQRGTGLGLSIVQQLVHKMGGRIHVESQYREPAGPHKETGTIFTLTIPIQEKVLVLIPVKSCPPTRSNIIAIIREGCSRMQKAIVAAWELFNYKVIIISHHSELSDLDHVRLVWIYPQYIKTHTDCLAYLGGRQDISVLVLGNEQKSYAQWSDLMKSGHFIKVSCPLAWHKLIERLSTEEKPNGASSVTATAGMVHMVDSSKQQAQQLKQTNGNVLLVEDNTINQKLGIKMLSVLGYTVLTAMDGDEAIAQTLKHDISIDIILMDQSMPTKDGVTTTRELRQLENQGKLKREHVIIALTAVVDSDSKADFMAAGANEFLSKPLALAKLKLTLADFMATGSERYEVLD